ncbi:MAG: hypothetical protein AB8G14_06495 [Ilumatobacter sp.]
MSDPTLPNGQQPAVPPRFDERSSGQDFTGDADDATPPHGAAPAAGAAFAAGATVSYPPAGSTPPGQYPPGQQPPPQQPPGQYPPTQQFPGAAGAPPPAAYAPVGAGGQPPPGPGGPGYGGPPPGGGPNYGGPTGPSDEPKKKKNGLLIGGLIALVLLLVGALGFVFTQTGGDADDADAPAFSVDLDLDDTPLDTVPVLTLPETTTTTTTTTSTTTSTTVLANGTVDAVFVRVEAFPAVLSDAELGTTLERVGLADGNNPVSTPDPVLNLCAALPVESPVAATVSWTVDNASLSDGAERVLASPADGNCINNSGEPLAAGAYEVSFTDAAGNMSGVALFTVGAATVEQEFVNDTGIDLCAVELAPSSAGFFQSFEVVGGEPLVAEDSILIDIASVEHEVRGIGCDDVPLESVFTTPTSEPVSLTSGVAVPPVTTPPPPPPQITDTELDSLDGQIDARGQAFAPGSVEEQNVIDQLLNSDQRLRIATEDVVLALCAAWDVAGPFDGDMVWEFNREQIARFPVSTGGGPVGRCVPPGGDQFPTGAYQVYLERGEFVSQIETFTVGRAETQLGFRNDTGVAVCRVGFSPNLTNWFTFYDFADSSEFDAALTPGEAFTIVAPFIENDIRAFDCDGNQVAEALGIPPTDQTLNLTTGQP